MFRKSLSMMLAAVMVFTAFPAGVMAEETNQPETEETAGESSSEKAQEAEETNQPEPEETAGESSSEEAQEAKETDQPETKETAEESSSEKAQEAEETEESIADELEDQNDEDVYYANPNEQRSSQGEAYAVFYDNELTFFRSNNTYSNNSYGTFTDINGNEYEGRVYCGFETAEYGNGSSVPWYENRASIFSVKVADDQLISPKSMAYWFNDCERLPSFDYIGFDTSNVTNMRNMFSGCDRLTSVDLFGFDTSNVVSMQELFHHCFYLIHLDISSFDTGNVTNMRGMFSQCDRLTSLDISYFDTSNVTDMSYMFYDCESLASLDISHLDASNVTNMAYMFYDCESLASLDISDFETSNVTDMYFTFCGCKELKILDLSCFDTSKVTRMESMFSRASNLVNIYVSEKWNVKNVRYHSNMFYGCINLPNFSSSYVDKTRAYYGGDGYLTYKPYTEPGDEDLRIVSAPYQFQVETPILLQAIYKGNRPDNFEFLVSDPAGFENLKLEDPLAALDDNYYIIRLTGTAAAVGEYDITIKNGNLEDTTHVSVTLEAPEKDDPPGDIMYQAEMLVSSSFPEIIELETYPAKVIQSYLDLYTPSELLLESAYENNLDISADCWEGVNIVLDAYDDPTSLVEKFFEPATMYEAIIMDILEANTSTDVIDDEFEDNIKKCADFLGYISGFMKDSYDLDITNSDAFRNMSEKQQKDLLAKTGNWFSENYPDLADLGECFKGFTNAFKIVGELEDFNDLIINCMTLLNVTDDMRSVLEECYKACDNFDDFNDKAALKVAFGNCLSSLDRDVILNIIMKESNAIGKKAVKYAFKEVVWKEIKSAMSPELLLAMTIVKSGKDISNLLFASDNITDAYMNLKCIVDVENTFRAALESMKHNYILTRNEQSAAKYLTALKLTFDAIDINCSKAYSFVDAIDKAQITAIIDAARWVKYLFTGEEKESSLKHAKEIITTMQNRNKETYSRQTKAWVDYMVMNYNPFTGDFDWFGRIPDSNQNDLLDLLSFIRKKITIQCPVDVYLYNSQNEMVASIVDGIITNNDENLLMCRIEDAKIVYTFSDEAYRIEYVGNDTGSMDITIEEFNENEDVIRTEFYDDISVTQGENYIMPVPSENGEEFNLINENDKIINPAYDTADGQIYNVSAKDGVLIRDDQIVLTDSVPYGKTVTVRTETLDGYTFVNWVSSNGEDIFTDKYALETSFIMPDEDIIIKAEFKENEDDPQVKPQSISLNTSETILNTNEAIRLTASIEPSDANNKKVIWTSSDTKIAIVDRTGKVTALRYGKATIKAEAKVNPSVTAVCTIQTRFYDVNDSTQSYYKPVYWGADNGVVAGYDGGVYFGPDNVCTRAQFVTFLWRLAGKPEGKKAVNFKDIDKSVNYYRAVKWAVSEGIIVGYKDDNTFRPDNEVTRGQVATMLWRFAGKKTPALPKTSPFSDINASNSSYRAVVWGQKAGVIKGYKDGTFKPDASCLRQHIVTFLYRYARDVMHNNVN